MFHSIFAIGAVGVKAHSNWAHYVKHGPNLLYSLHLNFPANCAHSLSGEHRVFDSRWSEPGPKLQLSAVQ